MNILLTFDNSYVQHASATLASLCLNNKGKHSFFVISDKISIENQKQLTDIADKYHSTIDFIFINPDYINDFPTGKYTANTYINIAAYFRLFLADVLPSNIKKILYLDCDVLINGSLTQLWNSKFKSNCCVMAVEDSPKIIFNNCNRLGYDTKYSYFNSGVLLINLQEFKKYFNIHIAIDYIKNHHILYHDQDVLNGIFHDKKEFINIRYNLLDCYIFKNASIPNRYSSQIKKAIYQPTIIHFSGPIKPWHKECKNPYKGLYYHYLKMTPWSDSKPIKKYTKFKDVMIYKGKNTLKFILEILHIRCYSFRNISINTDNNIL